MDNLTEEKFGVYKFKNVWKNSSPEIQQRIIEFWKSLNALPAETKPEDRVKQVVFIIEDSSKNIVGICTAYPSPVTSLGFNMYYFRCLVQPDHRQYHLAAELLLRTRKFLNEVTNPNDGDACKGVIVESENPIINQAKNEAIWPYSGMIYIGKNKKGSPVRIHYFDDARVL